MIYINLIPVWTWLNFIGAFWGITISLLALLVATSTFFFLSPHRQINRLTSVLPETESPELSASLNPPPLVTILKPLKGLQAELSENLISFLNLKDVPYEVLIGIADRNDPAVAIVETLMAKYPEAPIRLVFTTNQPGTNPKISNLIGLEVQAQGEILLISDDSTRAHPDSLKFLIAAFNDSRVGWACAPCFVRQSRSFGTKLRSLFIGGQLAPIMCGVYCCTGVTPTMGSWLAIRKQALVDMGGFAALSPFLAEDGAIGPILIRLGWKGAIIPEPIDRYLGDWNLAQAWAQAVRWARLFRMFSPIAPLMLVVFNGTFWLLLAAIFAAKGMMPAALFLAIAGLLCWLCNSFTYVQLGGAIAHLALLPFLDIKMMLVMLSSYTSNEVIWQGQHFRVSKNSQIVS